MKAEVFLYLLGPACCAGGWGGGSILCLVLVPVSDRFFFVLVLGYMVWSLVPLCASGVSLMVLVGFVASFVLLSAGRFALHRLHLVRRAKLTLPQAGSGHGQSPSAGTNSRSTLHQLQLVSQVKLTLPQVGLGHGQLPLGGTTGVGFFASLPLFGFRCRVSYCWLSFLPYLWFPRLPII